MTTYFNKHFELQSHDALKVTSNDSVLSCTFKDTSTNSAPHRDAIQIIPPTQGRRLQYALAEACNIRIMNNTIRADHSKLQGIFISDGLVSDILIRGNKIATKSFHAISIAGLMSGMIENNTDVSGKPLTVNLYLARIGGARNIRILSFKDRDYPCVSEVASETQTVNDYRLDKRPGLYLKRFDRESFLQEVLEQNHETELDSWLDKTVKLALRHGTKVTLP